MLDKPQFRHRYIQRMDTVEKICFYTGILLIKIEAPGYGYKITERLNPWNPLTYLALLIIIIYDTVEGAWIAGKEDIAELPEGFKGRDHIETGE